MTDIGMHAGHGFTLAAHLDTEARALDARARRLLGHFGGHFAVAVGLSHRLATRGPEGVANPAPASVKSVFQKLGVHSQLQLQRTLQALAAPAHDLH
jgi:hypothetical protein